MNPTLDLEDALAEYIHVLTEALGKTNRAEDRPKYEKHLAAAARMFAAIHSNRLQDLSEIIDEESHGYGWSFLSGAEGDLAEAAFVRFAEQVLRGSEDNT